MIARSVVLVIGLATGIGGTAAMAKDGSRTWCVGRLVFDLPAIYSSTGIEGDVRGVEVAVLGPGSEEDLRARAASRVAELRAGRAKRQNTPLVFRDARQQGDVYLVAYASDYSDIGGPPVLDWNEEAYVRRGGVIFRLGRFIDHRQAKEDQADLMAVAEAVRPRAAHDIPQEAGACLKGAFVALPPGNEDATAGFVRPDVRPVGYSLTTLLRAPGAPPLPLDSLKSGRGFPYVRAFTFLGLPYVRAFTFLGLPALEQHRTGRYVHYTLVAGRPGSADGRGAEITLNFFDERPDAGTTPAPREASLADWQGLLASMHFKP